MNKKYKFGEIVWVVGHDIHSIVEIYPMIYKTEGDTNILSAIGGEYSYQCNDIEHGIRKVLAVEECLFMPNATEIENKYSIIKNIEIFKMALYGLKEKATVFANNFHYRGMIFNAEDYYNLKIANKEYTVEELYKIAEKVGEIYFKRYEDKLYFDAYDFKFMFEKNLKDLEEKYNENTDEITQILHQ